LVNDLLTKGVDWTEARQFFPICNTQYGDFWLSLVYWMTYCPHFVCACTILGWWIRCCTKLSAWIVILCCCVTCLL
jgi:hypothetical protein